MNNNEEYMNYDSLTSDLNSLINDNFDIYGLREIRRLYINLNRVHHQELAKKEHSSEFYNAVFHEKMSFFNDTIWNALKEKLGFEDEVINKVFNAIRALDQIDEIYVIDGTVITTSKKENDKSYAVSSELNYVDITDSEFTLGGYSNELVNLVVMSINNSIKPFVSNKADEDVISNDHGKVNYLIDDLKVYVSRTMPYILSDNTGTLVTKVLATYQDKILYFDLKMRDNYVILLNNDYNINVVSQMLEEKGKTKLKK